jgi:transcriptional antiterminator NusG
MTTEETIPVPVMSPTDTVEAPALPTIEKPEPAAPKDLPAPPASAAESVAPPLTPSKKPGQGTPDEPEKTGESGDSKKRWYVVKVATAREESIKAAIERKIKIEGLEQYFGQIVIPVERITEVKKMKETKNGEKVTKEKRVVKERKKYPGYLMAEVEFNDQILYVFRETNGVGDFVGATGPLKPPPPMSDREVAIMLGTELSAKDDEKLGGRKGKIKVKIDIEKGDKVRLRDGAFAGTEGEVIEIAEAKDDTDTPKITVEVQFWGRPVKIDSLEYWQVDKV